MKIKIRSTFKKIFALILLFALLLSASAFLTSFRTKEPISYFSEPEPPNRAPTLSLKHETVAVGDDLVLLVDFKNVADAFYDSSANPFEMGVTVEIEISLGVARATVFSCLDFTIDRGEVTEELVIPFENFAKDEGELIFYSSTFVYKNKNYYGTRTGSYSTKYLHYQKDGEVIRFSWITKAPPSDGQEQAPNQDTDKPQRGFGCAAWPTSADKTEQEKNKGGGGSPAGGGGQSAM